MAGRTRQPSPMATRAHGARIGGPIASVATNPVVGIFGSAGGASEPVRRRQRATRSTFPGSVACADDRIVLASRGRRQTERDPRVDGVAEVGADSRTHGGVGRSAVRGVMGRWGDGETGRGCVHGALRAPVQPLDAVVARVGRTKERLLVFSTSADFSAATAL